MGNELLTTGSIIAAFFAGGVALFAPCCIVFLAPSYLAGAVKNSRWRLLPLTFVFAAGLGLVLVPITLGMGLLAGAVARYHAPLYYAGGILMFALALLALSGRMWSLPSFLRAPDTTRGDTASFFALSVLSGSPIGGFTLGVAYVFGMVFPLFVMALIWDKAKLGEKKFLRAKAVRFRVAGRLVATNTLNIAVAVAFVVMGAFVIALAGSSEMTGGSAFQTAASEALTGVFSSVQDFLSPVPEPLLGLGILGVALVFVLATLSDRRVPWHRRPPAADADPTVPACHVPAGSTTSYDKD